MIKDIQIAGRKIGLGHKPYVIAELSANHNGSIDNAFRIIKMAKTAGADAIKIQTYRPDTITIRSEAPDFQISGGLWAGKSLYELYEWAHTPWSWHADLFKMAADVGITMFSSPFDDTAVDLLESLDAPAYKIASFELVDHALIRRVAETGKPVIMSSGMANAQEIREAIEVANDAGCLDLIVLHCVSGYPTPRDQYNLRTVADIRNRFGVLSGLSDHTISNATAVTSVAFGSCVIEKHVTLDRTAGGPDDSFSIEPAELRRLCSDVEAAHAALGEASYERTEAEKGNVKFRRSLYYVSDGSAGERITERMVKSIRPGYGIPPKYLPNIIGLTLSRDVKKGERVTFDDLADYMNRDAT